GLIRQLAVPSPPGLRALPGMAHDIAAGLPKRNADLGGPVPAPWLDRACGLGRELASRPAGLLIHADLHYGNILAGDRLPWLAVDPRPVDGDPAFSIPELMWTRAGELSTDHDVHRLLATLAQAAEVDQEAAHGWTIVRCVDYWLWGLQHGLTIDPARCERVLTALLA
ncbi:aminoglycoside phosphotransferase family protein, partial [Allorhizocola rhizosphaerae]|uniref:aminoglycoside phosphotransferase family protein n=1 Tax=Allorhizocola rhizosphaerae TaxID=1872709 RepID=UPI001FE4620A